MLFLFGACTIRSNNKISEKTIDARREMFEKYLKEKYPDETFTVKVWQEYAKDIGSAGLPDYERYLIRQVVIDSEGNCFMVFPGDKGECKDNMILEVMNDQHSVCRVDVGTKKLKNCFVAK